ASRRPARHDRPAGGTAERRGLRVNPRKPARVDDGSKVVDAAEARPRSRLRSQTKAERSPRAKAQVFARKRKTPGCGSGGRFPFRQLHLFAVTSPELGSAAQPRSRLFHPAKRLLQPTLASGSVARWPHCTSETATCQVTRSSDFRVSCLTRK